MCSLTLPHTSSISTRTTERDGEERLKTMVVLVVVVVIIIIWDGRENEKRVG